MRKLVKVVRIVAMLPFIILIGTMRQTVECWKLLDEDLSYDDGVNTSVWGN